MEIAICDALIVSLAWTTAIEQHTIASVSLDMSGTREVSVLSSEDVGGKGLHNLLPCIKRFLKK